MAYYVQTPHLTHTQCAGRLKFHSVTHKSQIVVPTLQFCGWSLSSMSFITENSCRQGEERERETEKRRRRGRRGRRRRRRKGLGTLSNIGGIKASVVVQQSIKHTGGGRLKEEVKSGEASE